MKESEGGVYEKYEISSLRAFTLDSGSYRLELKSNDGGYLLNTSLKIRKVEPMWVVFKAFYFGENFNRIPMDLDLSSFGVSDTAIAAGDSIEIQIKSPRGFSLYAFEQDVWHKSMVEDSTGVIEYEIGSDTMLVELFYDTLKTYLLTSNLTGSGQLNWNDSAIIYETETIDINFTPDEGFYLKEFAINDSIVDSVSSKYSHIVTDDLDISVIFKLNEIESIIDILKDEQIRVSEKGTLYLYTLSGKLLETKEMNKGDLLPKYNAKNYLLGLFISKNRNKKLYKFSFEN
jgi:hypothetical protein